MRFPVGTGFPAELSGYSGVYGTAAGTSDLYRLYRYGNKAGRGGYCTDSEIAGAGNHTYRIRPEKPVFRGTPSQ